MATNPNLAAVRDQARAMGAEIIDISYSRHDLVTLRTKNGETRRITLSKSRIDPRVLRGWVRQGLNRAVRPFGPG
jgi:hypothetical protein